MTMMKKMIRAFAGILLCFAIASPIDKKKVESPLYGLF